MSVISKGLNIAETLEVQLTRVQEAIAAIESGAQAVMSEGESMTRPSLDVLYKREERILNKIAREAAGGPSSVAEF